MSRGLTLPTTTTFNIAFMYIILTLCVLFVAGNPGRRLKMGYTPYNGPEDCI
jgi:hypothetical protein